MTTQGYRLKLVTRHQLKMKTQTNIPARLTGAGGISITKANGAYTISAEDLAPKASPTFTGQITTDGQIKFPSVQVPSSDANTFDDYEEGDFTPAWSAAGATFSYASQLGSYCKIGRLVFITIRIALNTSGNTLAGAGLILTGLPFAQRTGLNTARLVTTWANATSTLVNVQGTVASGGSFISMSGLTAGGVSLLALADDQLLHATNGSIAAITGTYMADS